MATIAPEDPVSGLDQARGILLGSGLAVDTVDLISSASASSMPLGFTFVATEPVINWFPSATSGSALPETAHPPSTIDAQTSIAATERL